MARDAATGKWVSHSDATGSSGVYTIEGLPAGDYLLEIDYPGYQKEYYNNVYDKATATPVTVTEGTTTSSINFSLESRFNFTGGIQHTKESDGSSRTLIEIRG